MRLKIYLQSRRTRCPLVTAALAFVLLYGGVRRVVAEPVAVRYPQGTTHGFLVLRTLEGKAIADGDLFVTVRGNRVTSRLTFRFHDGSIDDDSAVFTQSGSFRLEREHHIQRGPSFPKPLDLSLDIAARTAVLRETASDGVEKRTEHRLTLTPDLANGMFLTLLTNIRPDAPKTTVPLVVSFEGVRIVHLVITPEGLAPMRTGGSGHPAQEFLVHIDIGGAMGVAAPVLGKQPEDVHVWILEGVAPAFVREQGQLYEGGPVWRIEQVAPALR